ncbi:MAG: hypothetical protein ACYC2O_07050 [Microthrixaceae bacterium]
MSQSGSAPITRDDIKSKLDDMQGEALEQVDGVKNQMLAVGVGVGLVLLIVAFLLGRRGGKRSSTIIEVRRS